MNNTISRRKFLKTSTVFIGGLLLLPIARLFSQFFKLKKNTQANSKEAKYYSSGKNLAG